MAKILSIACLVMAILSILTFFLSIVIRIYDEKHDNAPKSMADIVRFNLCPCMLFLAGFLMFKGM